MLINFLALSALFLLVLSSSQGQDLRFCDGIDLLECLQPSLQALGTWLIENGDIVPENELINSLNEVMNLNPLDITLNITEKCMWVLTLWPLWDVVQFSNSLYRMVAWELAVNSSPPGQNGRLFAYDIFRCTFMNEKICIFIEISMKFFS